MQVEGDGAYIARAYFKNAAGYVRDVLQVKDIEPWQLDVLNDCSAGVPRIAVGSGHGIGKTALTAWVTHWFNATRPNPQGIVTANTKNQLDSKTSRELSKWNERALNGSWFGKTTTRFFLKDAPETWFTSFIPWTEHNSEAFAGTHEKHVLIVFDEASAIADVIWDVCEGAMTQEGALWLCFGNPTRNTGRFRECFGKFKHRWKTYCVDSREVSITNKAQIAQWIEDYGEDSDFIRVRVKGQFPRSGNLQFIPGDAVDKAMAADLPASPLIAKIMGIDLARSGNCQNVIATRQGRNVAPLRKWREADSMKTVTRIIQAIEEEKPDAVFLDGGGLGGPIIDRVKELADPRIIFEVNGGLPAMDSARYYNKRAEMWGGMRDFILAGADLPEDSELRDDLIGPEYGYSNKQQIQLEKKEDMAERGLASPDSGDAVALTFAYPVLKARQEEEPSPYAHAHSHTAWMGA
jgi:hypothetical protein